MDADEFDDLARSLGICQCHAHDSLWLLRELLEIGEARLYETDDEDEAEFEGYMSWLRLSSVLNDQRARQFVLGALSASELIEHADDDIDGFWLAELGSEALEHMREVDRLAAAATAVNAKEMN